MAKYLLQEHDDEEARQKRASRNPFVRFQLGFEHYFEKFRVGYLRFLDLCRRSRRPSSSSVFIASRVGSVGSLPASSGRTSSPPSTPASSRFTSAPTPARASKKSPRSATRSTTPSARHIPANEVVNHHRQHRPALHRPESLVLQLRSHRPRRCRHPGAAHREAPPHRRLRRSACAQSWPASIPASPSTCCPSTSSPRFSTSACPRPSISRSSGPDLYGNRALAEQHAQRGHAMFPAPPMRASSSPSTTPT